MVRPQADLKGNEIEREMLLDEAFREVHVNEEDQVFIDYEPEALMKALQNLSNLRFAEQ